MLDVIQNWEVGASQFYSMVLFLLAEFMVEGEESSWQFWPATGPFWQTWVKLFTTGYFFFKKDFKDSSSFQNKIKWKELSNSATMKH